MTFTVELLAAARQADLRREWRQRRLEALVACCRRAMRTLPFRRSAPAPCPA